MHRIACLCLCFKVKIFSLGVQFGVILSFSLRNFLVFEGLFRGGGNGSVQLFAIIIVIISTNKLTTAPYLTIV